MPPPRSDDFIRLQIRSMMFGLGDSPHPSPESVRLVSDALHYQMKSLLLQASVTASSRLSDNISYEDVLFMLRKDKEKLSRLLKRLEIKSMQRKVSPSTSVKDLAEQAGEKTVEDTGLKMCLDFLSTIDQTGELVSVLEKDFYDEIKFERIIRQDQLTRNMDYAQYKEYSAAREAGFSGKNQAEFDVWLKSINDTGFRITPLAAEMIGYLAYETVAQIVDLALLVKRDAHSDRVEGLQSPGICNTEYPSSRFSSCRPNSPSSSSGERAFEPSQTEQTPVDSGDERLAVSDAKMMKYDTPDSAAKIQTAEYDCILPSEIREAIIRYFQQTGPFCLFSAAHRTDVTKKLLCC